ncbi:DUF4232 domain-containing protein [Geodermatophilus sp. SYSU D01105]
MRAAGAGRPAGGLRAAARPPLLAGLSLMAWPTLLAGLSLMAWAGLRSARHRPAWLEPEPACLTSGECTPAEAAAGLTRLWWVVGAGAVLVLLGVALVALRRTGGRTGPPARGSAPSVHAGIAAAVGSGVALLLEVPVFVALFAGPHAVPVALAVVWLVQAEVLTGLDVRLGGPGTSLRRAWLTGLGVSAAATGLAGAAVGAGWVGPDGWWSLPLATGLLLGAGVAVARMAGQARAGTSPRRGGSAAVLLGVFGLTAFVLLGGVQALVVAGVSVLVASDPPLPEEPGVTVPAPTTAPPPSPVSLPPPVGSAPPPRVAAGAPCSVGDLDLAVVGFDAALGARAASVQARNTGDAPCWVEGVPVVTLLQGGRPLTLTVEPGQSPTGGPAVAERVGIAPGGTALALLTWRTHAGWADAETPQMVTVALDPSSPPVEAGIVGGSPQAPFDIADAG